MIVMHIEFDNIACFNDFSMNMSYPKKIVGSSVEEYLEEFENFRYKKVNILVGMNASGKTTFGKVMMSVFNFIHKREVYNILKLVTDYDRPAKIIMDFIPQKKELYGITIDIPAIKSIINPDTEKITDITLDNISIRIKKVRLKRNDSYEQAKARLAKSGTVKIEDIPRFGWLFTYPIKEENFRSIANLNVQSEKFLKVLNNVLKTLDNSIIGVSKLEDIDDTYVIKRCGKHVIIKENQVLPDDILSSGTLAGIEIANLITAVIEHYNGFYYCDEKFSYIQSNVEQAILSLLISNLKNDEQLFFTTHNLDILDMDLPKHSFVFMHKELSECNSEIKIVSASDYLKKSSDSVRNAMENDMFDVMPNLGLIYDIDDID